MPDTPYILLQEIGDALLLENGDFLSIDGPIEIFDTASAVETISIANFISIADSGNAKSWALQFNGSNQYVNWGSILQSGSVFTVAFWLLPTSTPSGVFEVPFGFGNTRWFFIFNGATTQLRFAVKIGGVEKIAGTSSAIGTAAPKLCIGSYDQSGGSNNLKLDIYNQDGTLFQSLASTQTGAVDTTGQSLRMAHDPNRNYYIDMIGDNPIIWSRILSTEERQNLALGLPVSATNLELWCPFDEGQGTIVADRSGNNRNGTLVNTPTFIAGYVPVEALSILNTFSLSETGNGADTLNILASMLISDLGSGTETIDVVNLLIAIAISDSGSASEAVSILVALTLTDNGSLAQEIITILASIALSETGAAQEALQILASIALSDSGIGNDVLNILSSCVVSDTGIANDALNILAQIAISDSGAAGEALLILAQLSVSDTAIGSDALNILVNLIVSDSGLGSEAINILVGFLISDAGAGSELVEKLLKIDISDNATAKELLTLLVLRLSQMGSSLSTPQAKLYNKASDVLYNK